MSIYLFRDTIPIYVYYHVEAPNQADARRMIDADEVEATNRFTDYDASELELIDVIYHKHAEAGGA